MMGYCLNGGYRISKPEEELRDGQVRHSGQRAVVGMGWVMPGNSEDATEARRQEARERCFGRMYRRLVDQTHDSSLGI